MKSVSVSLLCALICSSSGFVKRDVGGTVFREGIEYVYKYDTAIVAGTQDYLSFGSSFNITGTLRVQGGTSNLKVKLDDLKFGVYNGEYQYFPSPNINLKEYAQLNPLMEPFHVTFENGKVNGIIVSADIPLWCQNIQRGIASGLQLDLTHINVKEATTFYTDEHTIMGDCPTNYIVIPSHDDEPAQIRKFRSHNECTNGPTKTRKPGVTTHSCQTAATRDVFNSSGATTFYIEEKDGHIVPKRIWISSAVVYSVFGKNGHTQYSHHSSNLALIKTNEGGYEKLAAPAHQKKYDDVKYVFESDVTPNTDLTKPSPYFYHFKASDISHDSMMTIAQKLHVNIENMAGSLTNMEVYNDLKKFHATSPFSVVPLVGSLDYEHLKECYAKYSKEVEGEGIETGKITQWKIFLDALVIAGTGPASLLVRDIVAKTEDTRIIARVLAPYPNYVREPSDALVKEFEQILRKEKPTSIKTKLNARLIDFAFGSLLGRSCKKDLCKSSGLLEKYITYYVQKFENAETFEEKTAVVGVLRNIALEGALTKLVAIATDKEEEKSVRVAALGGVKLAIKKYPTVLQDKILPIFFDRTEHVELRNLAGLIYMVGAGDPKIMKQMVMYMWFENCPQVKNFLKSFLVGVSNSKRPCLDNLRAHATSALTFFPPWTVTRLYSENKFADYFDPEYNFGQLTHVAVQKTGKSALPNSIYVSLNGAIAGYGVPYLTFFVRMEGLGGTLTNEIVKMSTGGAVNFDKIKDVYNKIGVVDREGTPLKLELIVALHNRIVSYNAVDQKSLQALPTLLKSLAEMKSTSEIEIHRMMLLGGIMVESPNEFGTPVSVISGVTAFGGLNVKSNRGNAGTAITSELDMRMQLHLFGTSMINNHMPAFNTIHSVSAHRTLRYRVPRKVTYGIDIKQQTLNFVVNMPKEEDPLKAMTHATVSTNIVSEPIIGQSQKAVDLLHESCPDCKPHAMVSKGEDQRESRKLGTSEKIDLIEGIKSGVKYFDCERSHSRIHVYKMLKKYFGPANKNSNKCALTQVLLGLQYLRDSLFFSPVTQTCGMKAYFYQDKNQKSVFEKIEGSIKGKLDSDVGGKLGTKISVKSSLTLKYTGEKPKSRTIDAAFLFQSTGLEKKETKLKIVHHDGEAATNDVACLEVTRQSSKAPDFFSFEGDSEPTHEKTMKLVYGRVEKTGKDAACPKNAYEIKLVKKSRRSHGQKEAAASDAWPYKECREAKNNDAKYPGKLTPATQACVWAAFMQTNLMESNITIDYKVDVEARRRWKRPGALIASVLMPYWVPSESKETHHEHAAQSDDGKFAQGQIKIDVVNDEPHPVADIHFHGSQGQDEHFHDIDLSILPKRPVFARFDPFFSKAFELGFFGYCDVTPGAVQTFDNKTYYADMSDCNTLVSGDCSAKPKYAVLSRKSAADKIAITVYIADHVIEMENLNTAKVDGKDVKLTDSVHTEDEAKIFKMVKLDENNVYIVAMKFGVYIRYTGHYTTVTLGSRYRGTTCGVCGNYDFVKKNDFTGPDPTCKGIGPNEMMKAYIVRDGKCSGVGSTCPVSG